MKLGFQHSFAAFLIAFLSLAGCSATRKKAPQQRVPIAIRVDVKDNRAAFIDMDLYRYKLIEYLNQFQRVDLDLVQEDEQPEIQLTISIDYFSLWPKEQRSSRRSFSRNVYVGKDANNKPIYQTVTASADFVQVQIRSDAKFSTNMRFRKRKEPFEKVFVSNYRWNNFYVDNIEGDPRALEGPLFGSVGPPIDPLPYDFLLTLSRQEMVERISREIRSVYNGK